MTAIEPVSDATTLVAVSGADYGVARVRMLRWLAEKLAATEIELADLEEIRRMAKQRRWDVRAMSRLIGKSKASIVWYRKVAAAIEQGYAVLPDLPMQVFAVRRGGWLPPQPIEQRDRWVPNAPQLPADVLPAGEGAYVSPVPQRSVGDRWTELKADGKTEVAVSQWVNSGVNDVVLPVQILKPALVEATDRAMAAKLFDEIGLLTPSHETKWRSGRRDPLVVGRIYRDGKKQAALCFNIAWFVTLGDLA